MIFLFITLFLHLSQASAHVPEKGAVWLSVGPVFNRTVGSHATAAETFTNGGLLAEGDLTKHGGLEIGIYYIERQYFRDHMNGTLSESVNRIHVPLGYRHWWSEKLSGALAFYSSYRTGDIKEISRPIGMPVDFHTSATEKLTEYGFDLSFQYEPWRRDTYGITIDARYSWSITTRSFENADQISLMVAIKHLMEQK